MMRSVASLVVAGLCLIALIFGSIRMGVSLVLTLQELGVYDLAAFREPVNEIGQFLSAQNDQALIPLSPLAYLAIIAIMGLCLVIGSILSWRRSLWGYGALSAYLVMHASLFVNFQTINPKIYILIAGIIGLIILVFANQRRPS